jgi:hypothetical protein
MKLDEIYDGRIPPESAEATRQLFSDLLWAEDISPDEQGALVLGYLMGLSYGVYAGVSGAAIELVLRIHEFGEMGLAE